MTGMYSQGMVGTEPSCHIIKLLLYTDTVIRRQYRYDGKAGSMSFKISFEVKVQGADEVSICKWIYTHV